MRGFYVALVLTCCGAAFAMCADPPPEPEPTVAEPMSLREAAGAAGGLLLRAGADEAANRLESASSRAGCDALDRLTASVGEKPVAEWTGRELRSATDELRTCTAPAGLVLFDLLARELDSR